MKKRGESCWQKASHELLLSRLRKIQNEDGFLSLEKLKQLSLEMDIHLTKIYEVATFYSFFTVNPKGKYVIRVCKTPSCLVNGSEHVLDIISRKLQINSGETTPDNKFTLETTSCIGCCENAPAILINEIPYTNLTEEKIEELINKCC